MFNRFFFKIYFEIITDGLHPSVYFRELEKNYWPLIFYFCLIDFKKNSKLLPTGLSTDLVRRYFSESCKRITTNITVIIHSPTK